MLTSVKKVNGRAILKVHSDIIDMKSGEAFKAALTELFESGETEIVLDLSGISLINSHGIGKILMFYKRLREIGGNLYLAPLHGSMKEIFETIMLDKLLVTVAI
ncbi:MAG: STAS domain-containing protein [Syntrophobacteraceae bacterium]